MMNVENPQVETLTAPAEKSEVDEGSNGEVRATMDQMETGKAVRSDDIPVEAWTLLAYAGTE